MPQAIPYLIGLSVAGTVSSIYNSRRARKANRRAARVAARRRRIEARKASIAGIEDARQLIGTLQNVAGQTGGLGGSGVRGAVGSVTSQLGSNLTFNQQLLQFAQRQEQFLQQALNSQQRAQTFSSLASLSLSAAGSSTITKALSK